MRGIRVLDAYWRKDFNLLSEENSDFDILLSPASGKSDDDDEVFLGPVRHVEKCVAVGIDLNCEKEKSLNSIEAESWSPLNTDKFVEVSREANLLAQHYENHVEGKSEKMENKMMHNKLVEQFIEESKLKLILLKGISSPSCPRRETFVVQDSPLRLLPPAIQKRLQVCSSVARPGFLLKSPKRAAVRVTNSSVQPRQNCGNPSLGNNDVASCTKRTTFKEVPSSEQPCAPTKQMTSEKLKSGTRLTFSRKMHLNNTSEDLPDTTSINSDASDSPLHSSAFGHRNGSFAPNQVSQPKVSGSKASGSVKKRSASMAVRTRNHTSSTSSLHYSPTSGRAVSLNMPLNSSKLHTPKNGSRIAAPKSKSSSSTCAIDVPKTKLVIPANNCRLATPGKVNQQGSVMQTLSNKGLQRIGSITDMKVDAKIKSNKAVNALGRDQCPKSKTSIVPSQASKISSAPSPRTTRPKITEPKKLLSCSAIESGTVASTPNKLPVQGMLQTPNVPNRRVSVTPGTRRLSGLPTPLNRRMSGIPTFTSQTQPRPGSSSHQATAYRNRSMSATGAILASKQKMSGKPQILCSTDSSEEEMSPPLVPCFLDFSPDKPQTTCQETAKEHTSDTQIKENLIVEVNTKNKQIEDHPLIDLSNTPDLKRVAPLKAPEPLIDFSSPLIMLSPADKENVDVNSPLLKF
ncbi:G2 and S phase-expressed protein 1 isoform X3 [Heterodontus francisci]|uniref:G2 and S phase-expressed protein 1 isoform X3 n=1 Tax=Heterodontus francisci TaxID=7792 RepID=UPI00355B00C7